MGIKRVLIINAIPTNNGDAALVFGLYNRLKKEGHKVDIATFDHKRIRKLYPDYPIVQDILDHPLLRSSKWVRKMQFLLLPFLFAVSKEYRKADLLIGVPGGYLNSFYMFSHKLFVYRIAKWFRKTTAIYSQSVGPFDKRGEGIMRKYMSYLDLLLTRDDFSFNLAKKIFGPTEMKKIDQTIDAAFLWQYNKRQPPSSKKVAVSVRSWKKDGRDMSHYRDMIKTFCEFLLEKGYRIDFLSTCQGLPDYVNDSKEAYIVQGLIDPKKKCDTTVVDTWYDVHRLQSKLREYDFVVGTRLHMCILSLLNDVPAFNISYEVKGIECYRYLGMSNFSADYNEDISIGLKRLTCFEARIDQVLAHMAIQIPKMNQLAERQFKLFRTKLDF